MLIFRCRSILLLKNSLIPAFLPVKQSATTATTHLCSFHSTPFTCEKWKNKWDFDKRSTHTQQPTKNHIKYAIRQKRAETKRALRNLCLSVHASNILFQDEDPIWKFDAKEGWDSDVSVKKNRSRFPGRRAGKSNRRRMKRRFRRESFSEDFDNNETIFEAAFRSKWYTWSFRDDFTFRNSYSGFEWREKSDWTNQRTENQEIPIESESEDESYAVGSCSDRVILGLPPTGRLKLEDVKKAFRLSALKWHPDKHQGNGCREIQNMCCCIQIIMSCFSRLSPEMTSVPSNLSSKWRIATTIMDFFTESILNFNLLQFFVITSHSPNMTLPKF